MRRNNSKQQQNLKLYFGSLKNMPFSLIIQSNLFNPDKSGVSIVFFGLGFPFK